MIESVIMNIKTIYNKTAKELEESSNMIRNALNVDGVSFEPKISELAGKVKELQKRIEDMNEGITEQANQLLAEQNNQTEVTTSQGTFGPNPLSGGVTSLSGNVSQVGNIGRTPVYVTEEELYHIARIVNNEANFTAGRDGAVAVAEEIRNRVLQNVRGTTVNSILYNGYEKWSGTISSTVSPEVVEMCRNVFNGIEWYFGDDMVLSHASHQTNDRTHVYQHQSGINGTSPADSFYYPQISRQQTFYRWEHK